MELDEKFSNLAPIAVNILGLMPLMLCSDTQMMNNWKTNMQKIFHLLPVWNKISFVGKVDLAISNYKSFQLQQHEL